MGDIKHYNEMNIQTAKKSGGKAFLIPKEGIPRIKGVFARAKAKLQDYTKDEAEAEISKIDDQYQSWSKDYAELDARAKNYPYDFDLQETNNIAKQSLNKLEKKKIRIESKGLGVFALSKLALKKKATNVTDREKNEYVAASTPFKEFKEDVVAYNNQQIAKIKMALDRLDNIQKMREEARRKEDEALAETRESLQQTLDNYIHLENHDVELSKGALPDNYYAELNENSDFIDSDFPENYHLSQ